MLNIPLSSEQIIREHLEICPQVYKELDLTIAPKRYRKIPGERSSVWAKSSDNDKKVMQDKHLQELFRQWSMAGDPVADAFTSKFPQLKHHVAMKMLDTALEQGIDAVENPPEELVTLMAQVDHVPDWVDWESIDRTSELMGPIVYALGQTAWRAGFVLTFGNSYQGLPMVLTGALHKPETTPGRIKETLSVVNYLTIPGGLRRNGEALKLLVKVRVMHSLVRVNLLKNKKAWDVSKYGVPLPQTDMYAAWALVSGGLSVLEKLNGKQMNICALRYLMYLSGVDTRMPCADVEDLHNVRVMISSTLNHLYEPWASELTEAALSANLNPDANWLGRIRDKADRKLGELAITKIMGKRNAGQLGVTASPLNYVAAAYMVTPVVAKISGLKLLELVPGGRKKVRQLCVNYAYSNMGMETKFDTNPDEYRRSASEVA
ncbi:hypothetical protein [Spongiibacter marinus]|uniref:hypothetical protein n=1 Tax=Spongiibacter marinus TaxID=354246 RepID=UPI0035BE6F4C